MAFLESVPTSMEMGFVLNILYVFKGSTSAEKAWIQLTSLYTSKWNLPSCAYEITLALTIYAVKSQNAI